MASAFQMKPPMHGLGIRASHPLATGLVGYWPFWEGSGEVMDIVGGNTMLRQNSPTWTPSSLGQAMSFARASSEYLQVEAAAVSSAPLTMACWFNSDNVADIQVLMQIADKDVGDQFWGLYIMGSVANDPLWFYTVATAGSVCTTDTVGYSANTWHHACGVRHSAVSGAVYLDGGNKGVDTTSVAPANVDRTAIGRAVDSTPGSAVSGMIGLAKIWNRALSDAEVLEDYQDPYALIRPPSTITTFAGMGGGAVSGTWRPLSLMGVG